MALGRFFSTTRTVPVVSDIPSHVAIIMDGNGRWARKRLMPRVAGHKRGLETVRQIVSACVDRGIRHLTLFAFSSENWRRPEDEVSFLMNLFLKALEQEIAKLHRNNIRFRVVGDLTRFDDRIRQMIADAEALTYENSRLTLTIAANYGGRWDILNAVESMLLAHPEKRTGFQEEDLTPFLALGDAPEPDLFIRTGGEQRISNFLLWQLAYAELFFTDTLWPEFDASALDMALESFRRRERRFGRTSEQLQPQNSTE